MDFCQEDRDGDGGTKIETEIKERRGAMEEVREKKETERRKKEGKKE